MQKGQHRQADRQAQYNINQANRERYAFILIDLFESESGLTVIVIHLICHPVIDYLTKQLIHFHGPVSNVDCHMLVTK